MENKVGIVTWHYYANFGSGLQAFALQSLISSMGYKVDIINYRNPQFGKFIRWKSLIKRILHHTLGLISKKIYDRTLQNTYDYQKRYLHQTKCFYKPQKIAKFAKKYSSLVYGSDQIWAPNVFNPIYMGAYIPEQVKKISYAASVGLNEIPNELVDVYFKYLTSYKSISVREQEGKDLLKTRCGINSVVVLDPTLMVDATVYRKMLKPVKGVNGKFIFCYFLNKNHLYREKVEEYARKHNLQIVGFSDNETDSKWMNRLTDLGADQFLWLIDNAETIFTDSYHGSIFSLLFHKNFWTFLRFTENNPICQNSRIRQLQNNFGIESRVISSKDVIDDAKFIDFEYFEKRLEELRLHSVTFLERALKEDVKV